MEALVNLDFNFWRGRRVLLTGHTGFKGSWLLLLLTELGAKVWTYSLEPTTYPNLFSEFVKSHPPGNTWFHCIGDVCKPHSLNLVALEAQPDVVIHLAAQPLVRESYQDPIGTWNTNVMGSLHLLEALRPLVHPCAVVMVTTDKVYQNQEWPFGYRENDRLGGHDPYSSSKAAAEIAIASWRSSFCGSGTHQTPHLRVATARAGNVVGGGDWAADRIVPDAIRALVEGKPISVRNPLAKRPWQHVLEPLFGYLLLAETLFRQDSPPCEAFNFGPSLSSNCSVSELVAKILDYWPGSWSDESDSSSLHEATLLHLQIDKAQHVLGWTPLWDIDTTIARTVRWYRRVNEGCNPMDCCKSDLKAYFKIA